MAPRYEDLVLQNNIASTIVKAIEKPFEANNMLHNK
jgi:hypothetical protein